MRIGVSPLTNQVYLYEGKEGVTDVDEKVDVTNQFIGCLDILLENSKDGNIRFSITGSDKEFWLTKTKPK